MVYRKSSGSSPDFILVLCKYSWYALLASFVLPLYFFSRAFHAVCPLPTPSSRVLPVCLFTTLWAERSVVKNKLPKRFSFARVHVATAGEFCAVIGFGSPSRMAATLCQWNDRLTRSLSLYSKKWVLSLPSKRGYKFTITWMLSVSCSAMITPSDLPYTSSDSDALCLVPDAHHCSAVDVKVAVNTIVPRSPFFAFCTSKYRLL